MLPGLPAAVAGGRLSGSAVQGDGLSAPHFSGAPASACRWGEARCPLGGAGLG